jgi:hypothetical protein
MIWATPRLIGEVFLVNVTPSVPMGLYVRDFSAPVAVGEIVAVDQPAQARRVLGPLGFPTEAALLKRVAGQDPQGAIFLIGDGPNSFDSRAFGAAPTSSVRGVYRQVLSWRGPPFSCWRSQRLPWRRPRTGATRAADCLLAKRSNNLRPNHLRQNPASPRRPTSPSTPSCVRSRPNMISIRASCMPS